MTDQKIKIINDNLLRPGSQILVTATGENYIRTFSEIIDRLSKKGGRKGIIVSTQWSANALTRRVSLSKLPPGSLKVIDTISLSLGVRMAPKDDFVFLNTPVSLESLLMEIERIVRAKGSDFNYLLIDSLTHLDRYYTKGQLSEFFHYLLNRMLEEEFLVIIFDQESEKGSKAYDELQALLDHTIIIEGGGGRK